MKMEMSLEKFATKNLKSNIDEENYKYTNVMLIIFKLV